MNRLSDDDLLEDLAQSFGAPASQPSPTELHRFKVALAEHRVGRKRRRPWVQRPLQAMTASLIAATGAISGASLAGAALPAPLRSVAVSVGLPVDDNKVASARTEIADLQEALSSGDRSRVVTDYGQLQTSIQHMSGDDRSEVSALAAPALDQAQQVVDEPVPSGTDTSAGSVTDPSSVSESPDGADPSTDSPTTDPPTTDSPPTYPPPTDPPPTDPPSTDAPATTLPPDNSTPPTTVDPSSVPSTTVP